MNMINRIEHFITLLISDLLLRGNKTEICLNNSNGNGDKNILPDNKSVNVHTAGDGRRNSSLDKLLYYRLSSRQRFASFLFVIAEVHELFLLRSHCTFRQLYYRNVNLDCTVLQIRCAVADVSKTFGISSWNLGIFGAGKCFISGPLIVHMSNGDLIDCGKFKGATLIPPNFTYIDKLETRAKFVLVIEKNTVFQYLIANKIFDSFNGNIILVTARGYPDICTRWILHKLWMENRLNIYALVDCDPFGIEIMLIYRYGSLSQIQNALYLTCPQLKWLGVHATDVAFIGAHTQNLSSVDHNKINWLLARSYLDDEIKKELLLLQRMQCKVNLDIISPNVLDYIINKIKRQFLL